ncbi:MULTISPECIES: MaoC family dehydratase [unclassified Undibacterium]|uniref:MaoC family dehydratase n=1 Tax=unclassified Undibacterium TaxID=2630295 RepID=UPI002AC90C31|nr:MULTISPECIES: MaoC family dehydratase [unclassified Undibacterium]MEB0139117.1 MaoC family dehydratase [Undibacterium sp. CCC2.1]MEB0173330.1 MaoC family dehydratase [Undibacterium sp. CCC1.1]MEB0177630.1 MaoC family dehydratase [Undibacterium sp. CCC3.4]MEB0216806.1 MaoC family dehydratase [Undibacterium sp. 5I2]WPX43112.1 MaoC family dehydratase [Undibacterium sp. CCC3.4]
MREIHSLEQLRACVGEHVASSDWTAISQERVNTFAQATGDLQWIHIDVERASRESPFGGPIAHGFLTLSLLPMLMQNAVHLNFVKMGVNYGLNKVRFPAPVPVGSRLRAHIKLLQCDDINDGAQVNWEVTIEREGSDKPVCVAESIARIY